MSDDLGELKNIFYFDACGQINTEKTLKLAIKRAQELHIKKLVVASETGLSAIKAADMLRDSGINLIVVTSAAGTKIENTIIGDLRIGIPDKKIWDQLEKNRAKIVSDRPAIQHWSCFGTQWCPNTGNANPLVSKNCQLRNCRLRHSYADGY